MPKAYSLDLRERVHKEVKTGKSMRGVARRFKVSPSFVSKLCKHKIEKGTLEPLVQGGDRRSYRIEAHREWLLKAVKVKPDMTLQEYCEGLASRGLKISKTAVHNFFRRHKLCFKKRQPMHQNRSEKTLQQHA